MNIIVLVSTFFKIGYVKKAPGTFGSIAGLMLGVIIISITRNFFLLNPEIILMIESVACLLLMLIGWYYSSQYVKVYGKEDPKEVVIDEVVGQLYTLFINFYIIYKSILVPTNVEIVVICYLGSFILFRLFDIVKPWPISVIDRKVKGGLGIMLDDILAAFFAILTFATILLIYLEWSGMSK